MINAIVACDEYGGIGKNNTIPWPKIKSDMNYFKRNTKNSVVIMGSKTWYSEDMPSPLPNRINVVVTTKNILTPIPDKCIHKNILDEIKALEQEYEKVWIIGGESILNQTVDLIDNWYITKIHGGYNCDTFMPLKWNDGKFELLSSTFEFINNITFEIYGRIHNA